ncbi:MAG: STAS domain-containing protein [Thiotrichales bacterium]
MLYLKTTREADKICYSLEGGIDYSSCTQLLLWLSEPIDSSVATVMIDLGNVAYVTASGQRVLLDFYRKHYRHHKLLLTHANSDVHSSLNLTGLSRLFEVTKSPGKPQ